MNAIFLLTGFGVPLATQRSLAPVELEKRIRGDGVVTNVGPIITVSFPLAVEEAFIAWTTKDDAEIDNNSKVQFMRVSLGNGLTFYPVLHRI